MTYSTFSQIARGNVFKKKNVLTEAQAHAQYPFLTQQTDQMIKLSQFCPHTQTNTSTLSLKDINPYHNSSLSHITRPHTIDHNTVQCLSQYCHSHTTHLTRGHTSRLVVARTPPPAHPRHHRHTMPLRQRIFPDIIGDVFRSSCQY